VIELAPKIAKVSAATRNDLLIVVLSFAPILRENFVPRVYNISLFASDIPFHPDRGIGAPQENTLSSSETFRSGRLLRSADRGDVLAKGAQRLKGHRLGSLLRESSANQLQLAESKLLRCP
jgi:hypothetical protein